MLKDKVILVTGGGRGIGRAIALTCAEKGASVAVVYSGSAEAAENTVKRITDSGVKAAAYKCDVSDFSAVKTLVERVAVDFGRIDGLVNNAGITADNLLLRMKEEDYDRVLSVNLKGAFNTVKHTAPLFMKQRSGSIVNITSVVGLMGNAGQVNYASSKAGVVGLTKSVAKELAPRFVRCNAVAPGFIATDMTDKLSEEQKAAICAGIPLKSIGVAEDVAEAVCFLLSDASRYITGEVIKVDGGLYI